MHLSQSQRLTQHDRMQSGIIYRSPLFHYLIFTCITRYTTPIQAFNSFVYPLHKVCIQKNYCKQAWQ